MDPHEILDGLRQAVDLVQQGDELNEEEELEVKFGLRALEKMLLRAEDADDERRDEDAPRRQRFGESILGSGRR